MPRKSIMSVLLSLVLVAGMLAACSKDNNPNGSGNAATSAPISTSAGNETKEGEEEQGSLITKDPLELSIHMHYGNRFAFDDNWAIFKKAAELTNISLKGTAPATGSDSYEMQNLMLAAGKLPDIIHLYYGGADSLGPDGVLIDLRDLIDEHAPNIKKMLEEDPRLERFATSSDGNMYFIPAPNSSIVSKGWNIRQDWLDELSLPVPTTYEDFYKTLKAFKEKNPKRFPYISRDVNGIRDLLVFWGLRAGEWMSENDEVQYVLAHPNLKTAAQNLQNWYKEGLIDQEIFTRGPQAREIMFGDNLGGVTHDFMQSTTGFNDSLKDKIPGFKMVAMPPPQNIYGEHVEDTAGSFYLNHGWGISSESKHAVEAIKYFDFWFTEEAKVLSNYGIEGETYTIENGEIQLTDSVKDGNILENMYKVGAQLEFPHAGDPTFQRFVASEEAMKGLNMYADNNYMAPQFPPLSFSQDDKARFDELSAAVNTYAAEQFQKWIMGAETLDDATWDKYIQQLDRLGLQEYVGLAQSSYDQATGS